MKVEISPRVEIVLRVRALGRILQEIAKAQAVDQTVLDTIQRGVVEEQLISALKIFHMRGDECVAYSRVEIDWQKHRIYAKTGAGGHFEIDPLASYTDQIASAINPIIRLINDGAAKHQATDIRVQYELTESEATNPVGYADAMRKLGLVNGRWISLEGLQADAYRGELRPGNLSEISFSFRVKK